jgi:hypothetical protein
LRGGVFVRRSIVNRHTRESGYAVRRGGSILLRGALEYSIARVKPGDDVRYA